MINQINKQSSRIIKKNSCYFLVVRQHNQIGDMLCSLSLYKAIKKKYPDSHITLVASKTNYEIPFFDINPFIDRVLIFDKSSLKKLFEFFKQLLAIKYDFGFVPSTIALSRTSHLINFLSCAKKKVGVNSIDGKKNKFSFLLNVKSDFNWKGKHQLIRNYEIARIAGFELFDNDFSNIRLSFNDDDNAFAENFISENFTDKSKKIIAIHPGAGKISNIYPPEKFIELIQKIFNRYKCNFLITSGWTDGSIVNQIRRELETNNIIHKIVHNLQVKKLGALLSKTDLYITNDTGTMHIAGFSGVKMISLFGSTDPHEWNPMNKNSFYIKSNTGKIVDIAVDEVYNLVVNILH